MNWPAILVAQLEVGYSIARRRHVIHDLGQVIRLALRHYNNVIQQHVRIRVLRHQQVGGNHVARMQLAQYPCVFQLVRHGHGIHEARNGFMVQRHLVFGGIG